MFITYQSDKIGRGLIVIFHTLVTPHSCHTYGGAYIMKKLLTFLCAVLSVITFTFGVYGQTEVLAATKKNDVSKYLVYTKKDWDNERIWHRFLIFMIMQKIIKT